MFKKLLVLLTMLYAAVCFAAVDANKGSAAELDSIKGIGPAMSSKILEERKKGNFKDWNDFMNRVKGVREKTATKFSTAGLTINDAPFNGAAAAAAPAVTKDANKDAKKVAVVKNPMAETAKPAASAAK